MTLCTLTLFASGCSYDLTEDGNLPIMLEVSEDSRPHLRASTAQLLLTEEMAEEMIVTLAEALDCLRARPKD